MGEGARKADPAASAWRELVAADKITIETRCRHEVNGAWEPDARWRQGPGQDPLPRYVVPR